MARKRVVIEGDDDLRRHLEQLTEGMDDLRVAGRGASSLIANRAYRAAPVDSGALRDDIRTFATKTNAGMRIGRKRKPYAGPIIGGHGAPGATRPQGGYVLPNPFIFDAADDRAQAVVDTYRDFIDDLVEGKRPRAAGRYRRHTDE